MEKVPSPKAAPRIYVVDDEIITVRRLVQALQHDGYQVEGFTSGRDVLPRIQEQVPDVVVMDVRLKDADGVDLMQQMHTLVPNLAVILITGYASIPHAVNATKKGAFQYLEKPFRLDALRAAIQNALLEVRKEQQKDRLQSEISKAHGFGEIIGVSQAMQAVFETISRVAPVDCNVVIEGESGTGKELVARSLHANSPRNRQPFVSFNCGAFSEDLIANELFGHEKGAFTGAVTSKVGLLESANGGTVFLDEVGEMPLSMQVKCLRVLQERTFLRVGGVKPIDLDVRIIAATNRNIEKMIAAGEFRQDFFYRLKVVMIELPPLRSRRDDIPVLASHFAKKTANKFGKPVPEISGDFLDALALYPFPGNVRELEHIIERAVALSREPILQARDLPPDIFLGAPKPVVPEDSSRSLKSLEKEHISEVYRQTGFNQSETARLLGISRTTLWRRLHHFNLLPKTDKDL